MTTANRTLPLLVLAAYALATLLAIVGPYLPCTIYMLSTRDFPGSMACNNVQEDSQLVAWALSLHDLTVLTLD